MSPALERWRPFLREWWPALAMLAIALLLPILPFSEPAQKRIYSVAGIVFIYAILALGLNVVSGWTGLLDLGYVAFVAIGAYTVAILYRQPWMQFQWAWLACLLLAGAHAALWGTLRLGYVLFPALGAIVFAALHAQPWLHFPGDVAAFAAAGLAATAASVYGLRRVFRRQLVGDYFAIVTFAFAQILLIFVQNCTPVTNAARGYTDYPAIQVAGRGTGVGWLPPGSFIILPEGKGNLEFPEGARLVFPRSGELWQPMPQQPVPVPADVKVWPVRSFAWTNLPSGAGVVVPDREYRFEPPKKGLPPDEGPFYFLLLFFLTLTTAAMALLQNSRLGRAWLAMKADEISARANGISIQRHRMIAFAVSGFVGGIGGGLQAFKIEIVTPGSYDFWVSVLILSCIVLGGMGSIRGVLVGTTVLISLGEVLREGVEMGPGALAFFSGRLAFLEGVVWQPAGAGAMLKVPDQARYLVFGAILVAVMVFRPQGLLPPRGERAPLTPEERDRLRSAKTALFRTEK